MSKDTTQIVPSDRSQEPTWCNETVDNIASTTSETPETVRKILTLSWKAGYRTRDLQTKLAPAIRDWRDVGGPLSIFLAKYMGAATMPDNSPELRFLFSAQVAE